MIDTHQHLVCRVFTKNFLRDLQADTMTILENQAFFVDEEVKEVRDEFMPWLYQEVHKNVKAQSSIESFLDRRHQP